MRFGLKPQTTDEKFGNYLEVDTKTIKSGVVAKEKALYFIGFGFILMKER